MVETEGNQIVETATEGLETEGTQIVETATEGLRGLRLMGL